MPAFTEIENLLLKKFAVKSSFYFNNELFEIILSDKPRPQLSGGECKTDLYILGKSKEQLKEFKISIKLPSADFLENKISKERADGIFGQDWKNIITQLSNSIKDNFYSTKLIKHKTDSSFTITLGWKIEGFDNTSGRLAVNWPLSHSQKIEILSGKSLDPLKKNAIVCGNQVTDSGVANFMLVADEMYIKSNTLDEIVSKFNDIDIYASKISNMNFRFTALNYRSDKDKWDGPRPLAVYIDWNIEKGMLVEKLILDDPLNKKGNELGNNLRDLLVELNLKKKYISREELESKIKNQNILS